MQKIICSMLSVLAICSCSSTTIKYTEVDKIGANYSNYKKQYFYCQGESCLFSTKLEPYTATDFKPREPDYVPPITIVNNDIKRVKKHKPYHHKKKLSRKAVKKNSDLITKCFIVNKNESGNVAISGNHLIPVNNQEVQEMKSLESSVKSTVVKK